METDRLKEECCASYIVSYVEVVVYSVIMIIPYGALRRSRSSRHLRYLHHPDPPGC